jgi:hypothetical protein
VSVHPPGKGTGAGAHRRGPTTVGMGAGNEGSGLRWPSGELAAWGGGIRSEGSPNQGRGARMAALTEEGVDGGGSCMIPMRRRISVTDGRREAMGGGQSGAHTLLAKEEGMGEKKGQAASVAPFLREAEEWGAEVATQRT